MKNKIFVPTLIIFLILIGITFAMRAINNSNAKPGVLFDPPIVSYQATLKGEYVCLPHSDTSGQKSKECTLGLQTDDGSYYALDFNTSSQLTPTMISGDYIEATGVITPIDMISADIWKKYSIKGIFSVTGSIKKINKETIAYECNADAKICWDGSTVGRTGSTCQFAACPKENIATAEVYTSLGQKMTALTVTVNPVEVVSDGRCPVDVTCVWAGEIKVRTVLSTPVSHGEHILTLGRPIKFGEFTVTLTEVTPSPSIGQEIPSSSYRFTYEIKK